MKRRAGFKGSAGAKDGLKRFRFRVYHPSGFESHTTHSRKGKSCEVVGQYVCEPKDKTVNVAA